MGGGWRDNDIVWSAFRLTRIILSLKIGCLTIKVVYDVLKRGAK